MLGNKPWDYMVEYAKNFVGIPYVWGGGNPMEGFDCSGFVQWVFQGIGLDPKGDQTAQGLYDYFIKNGKSLSSPNKGALFFYGVSGKSISHVAIGIGDGYIIEAGGGDRSTTSKDTACRVGACVRQRPYNHRKDLVAILLPKYWSMDAYSNKQEHQ